jgi:hypothetical protein
LPDADAAADPRPDEFSRPNLVSHDLYAGSTLLGEALFFRLNLPERWQLAAGLSRPEVAATHQRKYKTWVANGDAWYVIYDQERRWALELAVRIRSLRRRNTDQPVDILSVGGHPASASRRTIRRGLPWKRHDVTYMTIAFECPITERRVELEFSGWCPNDGFEEMRQVVRYIICH